MSDNVIYVYSEGPQGAGGSSFRPDASGLIADRGDYDTEDSGFSYLATDEGLIYFRTGGAGNWTAGIPVSLAIELQKGLTHIQWRYIGDPDWTDLVSLADITGPAGGGAGDATLETDITAMLAVGNIAIGNLLATGLSFTEFVQKMLLTIFYPTFVAPTYSLAAAGSANQESGTTYSGGSLLRLTYAFGRGLIRGALVGGVWNPTTTQDFRAGAATDYNIDGSSTGTTAFRDVAAVIEDGVNTFSSTVTHGAGPQATDSDGANYLTPLIGATVTRTAAITGRRKAFYGVDNAGATSANIRALAGSLLGPSNGSSFTISIPSGAASVVFAYPSTLRDVNSVTYTEAFGAQIKDIFVNSTVSVEGANAYVGTNYKVYRYVPAVPFEDAATYEVTI